MKPTAILTADWHLRDTQPICRTDDFWESQWIKAYYISAIQKRYKCPVIHAGDLFHTWKTSPYLLSASIAFFSQLELGDEEGPAFLTVYGNHDLPQHSMELAQRSGMHTLHTAQNITILSNGHWGNQRRMVLFQNYLLAMHLKMLRYGISSHTQVINHGRVVWNLQRSKYLENFLNINLS